MEDTEMKKTYIQPATIEVKLQHRANILTVSTDVYGMARSLQSEEVDDAWTKEYSGSGTSVWDEEW
jgi:hypothetical protein